MAQPAEDIVQPGQVITRRNCRYDARESTLLNGCRYPKNLQGRHHLVRQMAIPREASIIMPGGLLTLQLQALQCSMLPGNNRTLGAHRTTSSAWLTKSTRWMPPPRCTMLDSRASKPLPEDAGCCASRELELPSAALSLAAWERRHAI